MKSFILRKQILPTFALTTAPSSRTYFAPSPNLVALVALLQPRVTPVSSLGLSFWKTDPRIEKIGHWETR